MTEQIEEQDTEDHSWLRQKTQVGMYKQIRMESLMLRLANRRQRNTASRNIQRTVKDCTKDAKDIGVRWHIEFGCSLKHIFVVDSACIFENDEIGVKISEYDNDVQYRKSFSEERGKYPREY